MKLSSVWQAPSARVYWWLFGFAGLSFFPTLSIQYIGEESVYPLMSYEMWFHGEYLTPIMYGSYYWRPPLYNLMIIPIAQLIGWDHMLIAARLVTLIATFLTALLLSWFARRLTGNVPFAAFTALVYVSLGDVLFYDGWLCYSDRVFALFVMASMILGWLALAEKRYSYMIVALLSVTAAFLTKALTAYIFYSITVLVVAYRRRQWSFLFSWQSLFLHGLALLFPVLWYTLAPAGHFQSHGMLADITYKFIWKGGLDYLKEVLIYPLRTVEQFLPIVGVLIFAFLRRQHFGKWRDHPDIVSILIVTLLNYLPYWLLPQSGISYLNPLYPFVGLILAYFVFYGTPQVLEWSMKWIIASIVLKFVCSLWLFPLYYERHKGSFEQAAQDIVRIAGPYDIYANNVAASGISTVANIDRLIYPKAPVVLPPAQFQDGFVISEREERNMGMLYKKYRAGGKDVYLLCRGEACNRR